MASIWCVQWCCILKLRESGFEEKERGPATLYHFRLSDMTPGIVAIAEQEVHFRMEMRSPPGRITLIS